MNEQTLGAALESVLDGRRLLSHPFYLRWSAGTVTRDELRAYAGQYRAFERLVPELLRGIAASATAERLRSQALQNLADETDPRAPHLALFERFAAALGAPPEAELSPAMRRLLGAYAGAMKAGPAEAFAALWSYEAQAPEISETKAKGLREHHGLTREETEFWELHAQLDVDHARWAVGALAASIDDEAKVRAAAESAARAWWTFLDEREALRPSFAAVS